MSLRLRLLVLFTVLVLVVAFAAAAVTVALRNVEANRALVTQTLQPASVQSRALLVALIDQGQSKVSTTFTSSSRGSNAAAKSANGTRRLTSRSSQSGSACTSASAACA